jgi:hypothetical protein
LCSDGVLRIWDFFGKVLCSKQVISESLDTEQNRLGLAWNESGELAVSSSLAGEITVFTFDRANTKLEVAFTLQNNEHKLITSLQ